MRYLLLLMVSLFGFCHAQKIMIPEGAMKNFEKPSMQKLDDSSLNVYYEFLVQGKPPKNISKKGLCVLLIGKNFSKFLDVNMMKKDSIFMEVSKKERASMEDYMEILSSKEYWPLVSTKDTSNRIMVNQSHMDKTYQYEETIPKIDWKLEEATKEVIGHPVKKATATFRGRNYTAWYAPDIAVNSGPYLYEGLPGLILEVTEDTGTYSFTAVGINTISEEIAVHNEKSIIKVTRDKFRALRKAFYINPGAFFEKAYEPDGSEMVLKNPPSRMYDPIERE